MAAAEVTETADWCSGGYTAWGSGGSSSPEQWKTIVAVAVAEKKRDSGGSSDRGSCGFFRDRGSRQQQRRLHETGGSSGGYTETGVAVEVVARAVEVIAAVAVADTLSKNVIVV